MTFKIAGDGGHCYNTPGKRSPNDEREWSFNNEVILAFEEALKQYEGVEFLRTDDRTGKTDVPLKTRTDKANAWKANIYISFHHNANTGKWGSWTGTETYIYPNSASGMKLAKAVHPHIIKAYGLKDRGIKSANFHIVRETHMPAILIEGGYFDSTIDIKKLRDHNVLKAVGYTVAEGVAEYAGLKKKAIVQPASNPTQPLDSADGKLTKGERGVNVKQLNLWLHDLEYTTKTDDYYDQYTEAAFKLFLKSQGLPEDTVYTSIIGELLVKAIEEKKNLLKLDNIPTKNLEMYRLAKFVDTTNKDLIKQLRDEGYRLIEQPSK